MLCTPGYTRTEDHEVDATCVVRAAVFALSRHLGLPVSDAAFLVAMAAGVVADEVVDDVLPSADDLHDGGRILDRARANVIVAKAIDDARADVRLLRKGGE